ncbi:MAG: NADH-quinone oxidoreductase subunit K [Myxococcota bacterium]
MATLILSLCALMTFGLSLASIADRVLTRSVQWFAGALAAFPLVYLVLGAPATAAVHTFVHGGLYALCAPRWAELLRKSDRERIWYFSLSKLLGALSVLLISGWLFGALRSGFDYETLVAQCLAVAVFSMGAIGAIVRRHALNVAMGLVLMFNAAGLLVAASDASAVWASAWGAGVAAIAGAHMLAGLWIVLGVVRTRGTADLDELDALRDELRG